MEKISGVPFTFSVFISIKLLIFSSFLFASFDATNTECLARYVNDSASGNCTMRKIIVEGKPYLCLFATTDIPAGTELWYSFGDPKKVNLWWRNDVRLLFTYYCIEHKFCLHNLFLDNKPPIRSLYYNWTLVSLKWWAKYLISCFDIINIITVYWGIHSKFRYTSFLLFFFHLGFFHKHSQFIGQLGEGEVISLSSLYHFHPLHRHLDISRSITAESSPLHIASSRTRTGNFWFPSGSY